VNGYCPSALDPSRTIQGAAQQASLLDGLNRSAARWNVLANLVPFAPNDTNADPLIRTLGGEKWDGYPVARRDGLHRHVDQQWWRQNTSDGARGQREQPSPAIPGQSSWVRAMHGELRPVAV
jgi:phosphodiesterase/alkaline phosphatase D-like protein